MDETPERLAARPSWLLSQLAGRSGRLVFAAFASAGARAYHYRLLAALHEYGPASQAELGRRCRIDRSDVVTAVNQLVELGQVDRAPDPHHGRRNRVTITEPGRAQLGRLDTALDQVQDELLAPLSAADRDTLTTLLGRLLAHHQPD
ncbi:MarR family transcriptional regulator [Streptomyces sp. DSM 44915]|uniref:MarR family transcriptional regulator n=1 Tax=Streptomyces chisholmiae TaxID=3075540 RepID=A0ABU2JLC2_9ACTN|nr:MarR family transcriptional regulator [Streptomyces sp. DSM 44915]MDT0265781.1 MarR family transcriptional regulator [Streptomyces sp. DSM 44915]